MLRKMLDSEKVWGTIGKIGSILTLIALISGFFYWLFGPEDRPKLSSVMSISNFDYPPSIETGLSIYKNKLKDDELLSVLKKSMNTNLKITDEQLSSYSLAQYVEKAWPWYPYYMLPKFKKYCAILIENESEIQAENVVVDLPFTSGVAQIYSEGDKLITKTFDQSVLVGIIRPNKSIIVRFWSENDINEYQEKLIKITHKFGISSIEFSRQTYNISNALRSHIGPFFLLFLYGLVFLIIVTFVAVFKLGQQYGNRRLTSILKRVSTCPSLPNNCPIKTISSGTNEKCENECEK